MRVVVAKPVHSTGRLGPTSAAAQVAAPLLAPVVRSGMQVLVWIARAAAQVAAPVLRPGMQVVEGLLSTGGGGGV